MIKCLLRSVFSNIFVFSVKYLHLYKGSRTLGIKLQETKIKDKCIWVMEMCQKVNC